MMPKIFKTIIDTKLKYVVAAAVVLIIAFGYFGFESTAVEVETYEVQRGEFIVSVVVGGELIARESTIISAPSNIRSNLQIVELVPEGTRVKKGDFLIKFDTAEIENRLLDREDELKNQLIQREELIANQKARMVQMEAQLKIQEYSHEQAKIQYALMEFEPEIKQRQQEIDMKRADLQLMEAREGIKRQKLRDANDLRRKDEQIKRRQDDIDDLKEQIAMSTIYAPMDGLVVYKENYMGGTKEKIKVGASIHRRMQLIELPDLSTMKVKTAVNEVDISKIRRGQEVIITMDANENTYYGTITDIARLARNELEAANVKVFDVEVTIENNDETLKPGMSATCQIIADKIEDAVFIPLQAVFEKDGETFVYNGDDYKKIKVVTGQRNTDFIVIKEGLEAGQKVTLRDPFSKLEAIGSKIKEKSAASAAKPGGGQNISPDRAIQEFRGRMMRGGGMDIVRH